MKIKTIRDEQHTARLKTTARLLETGGTVVGTGLPNKRDIDCGSLRDKPVSIPAHHAGVDIWNRPMDDAELSDEILAILAIDPDEASAGRREGFEVDFVAYDEASGTVDEGLVGSVDIKGEAAWSESQTKPVAQVIDTHIELHNQRSVDDFDSIQVQVLAPEQPSTGRFNPEKYHAKQAKLAKRRAFHDIPEMLDNNGRPRFAKTISKRFGLAIDTYKPHARLIEAPVEVTMDTMFNDLAF